MHRDISIQNILFGLADAPEGYRGVLIDLDMAVRAQSFKSSEPAEPFIVS